jgi:hypothetical protein
MRRKILFKPNTPEGDAIARGIHLIDVRKFNHSDVFRNPENIGTYVDEVKRYEYAVNHFFDYAVLRLRENVMNTKYIKEVNSRLAEIKEIPELPLESRVLCSQLIKTIKTSFGPK